MYFIVCWGNFAKATKESYLTRIIIIFTLHLILLGWPNTGNEVAKPHSMHQENQNTYKFWLEYIGGIGRPGCEGDFKVGNAVITMMWTGLR